MNEYDIIDGMDRMELENDKREEKIAEARLMVEAVKRSCGIIDTVIVTRTWLEELLEKLK